MSPFLVHIEPVGNLIDEHGPLEEVNMPEINTEMCGEEVQEEEEEDKFRWNEEDEKLVRKVFEHKAAKSYNPEWLAKSIRNKANRASDCDGRGYPISLGGSKSRATYMKEFKEKYRRDPRLDEIFEVMNSRKLANGEREWGCGRSENAYVSRKNYN
ncbi:hypothetical protein ACJIZ3_021491 [Penstemon smallii]|uniref:Uncharacterized protein n=1 Tax=Penstemon smallii TaxID=265156 RepID=A0ABD3SLV8_9LAMI